MSEALTDVARGHLNRAVGGVVPLAVVLPEAVALIECVLVLHRHGHRDRVRAPDLFPD